MIQRGEWGPRGKRQPQVLTCLIQLLSASLLLESTGSMGITPPTPPTWAVERKKTEKEKRYPRTEPATEKPAEVQGDGRRKAKALSPSSIQFSTAWKNWLRRYVQGAQRETRAGAAPHLGSQFCGPDPPGHLLCAGRGGAGGAPGYRGTPTTDQ